MKTVIDCTRDEAKLRLTVMTLSDGSKVHNVELGRDQYGNAVVTFYCSDYDEAQDLFDSLENREFETIGQKIK